MHRGTKTFFLALIQTVDFDWHFSELYQQNTGNGSRKEDKTNDIPKFVERWKKTCSYWFLKTISPLPPKRGTSCGKRNRKLISMFFFSTNIFLDFTFAFRSLFQYLISIHAVLKSLRHDIKMIHNSEGFLFGTEWLYAVYERGESPLQILYLLSQ